jgi:flagellar biosynthetic protein FlhB
MTRQEVREELLRMEGDPKIRDRRRKLGRELALARLLEGVRAADVVVESPGGYAAALRFRAGSMAAPGCAALGRGELARRIREAALGAGVPVVERGTLAREICRVAGRGGEVPPELYDEVAEVLAYARSLRRRAPEDV